MKLVKRYPLDSKKESQVIELPENAEILSVYAKHEKIYISVRQDSRETDSYKKIEFAILKEKRHFYVDDYCFLGTIILDFGNSAYNVLYRNV